MFGADKSTKDYKLKQFDQTRGVDFGGWISPLQLHADSDGHGYEPCYPFEEMLEGLDLTSKDTILDLGCGKGYAIYLLRKYPFGRVDGVEKIESLARIARDNLDKLAGYDSRIHIYCDDVNDWEDYDGYNYFFAFNPFGRETTMNVAEKILESARRTKTRKYFIYQHGNYVQEMEELGFTKIRESEKNCLLMIEG